MTDHANVIAETRRLFEDRTGMGWDRVHLLGYMGSITHGTHTPSEDPDSIDDIDMMGIVIPPPDRVVSGVKTWEHLVIQEGVIDATFYSIAKAGALLMKGNPNIVGLLWLDPEFYPVCSGIGRQLLIKRQLFSTLTCYPSFVGYAYGQLHRMEAFDVSRMEEYEWLSRRLIDKWPLREVLEADSVKVARIIQTMDGVLNADQVHRFRSLHRQYFSGYMGAKRKGIVRRVGYDAKNAAHLIRLMRMCCEFLPTGDFQVDRTGLDADELRRIKAGEWSIDQVKVEASALFAKAETLKNESHLPKHTNSEDVAHLITALTRTAWAIQDEIGVDS